MHPDADALLDAIFDAPDDDTPRLVYADWLQEHGQENYAEFIRLQCAAARCRVWSDEANDLWVKIGRVWNRLADEWWPATAELWRLPCTEQRWTLGAHITSRTVSEGLLDATHFHRGFLRPSISVWLDQFLRYQHCWPCLPSHNSRLVLAMEDVFGCDTLPPLLGVKELGFADLWTMQEYGRSGRSSDYLDALLNSTHLRKVRTLDLSSESIVDSTVEVLLTSPNLTSVTEVRVWFNRSLDCDPKVVLPRLKSRFPRVIWPLTSDHTSSVQ